MTAAAESWDQILQDLYDSEINFQIGTMWDMGFFWKLGDPWNGYDAEGRGDTLASAAERLCKAVFAAYPDIDFTKERSK